MVSVIQNRQFFRIEMIPMNQVVTMDRSTLILIKLQSQRNSGAMSSLTANNKWIKRTLDWIEKDDCDNIVSLDLSDTFRIEWLIIYENIVLTLSNIGDIWFTYVDALNMTCMILWWLCKWQEYLLRFQKLDIMLFLRINDFFIEKVIYANIGHALQQTWP